MIKNSRALIYPLMVLLIILINCRCTKEDAQTAPVLTTSAVSATDENSTTCGGNITSDGGLAITARGVCWSTSNNPTIANSRTTDGTGIGSFESSITGLINYTKYYVRAYATNSSGTHYGDAISFSTGSVIDIDGNVYHEVTIGTQIWMVENLKTTKFNDGKYISHITNPSRWASIVTAAYCYYNNSGSLATTYGNLYNWYAVNTGKLAPIGWHVPSKTEWETLESYLVTNGYNYDGSITLYDNKLAKSLASTSGWVTFTDVGSTGNDQASNNSSGFTALPAGYLDTNGGGIFYALGYRAYWWSTTSDSGGETDMGCYGARLDYNARYVTIPWIDGGKKGFSVRCIKDAVTK